VLESPTECRGLEGEIARRRIPVIWGPILAGAPRLETRLLRSDSVAALAKAGAAVAISPKSRTGIASRFVLENAQLAVQFGMAPDQALRAVTLDAAKALGVADRAGSLQSGMDADLVILSGPPMSSGSKVQRVFVEGREMPLQRIVVTRAADPGRRAEGGKGKAGGG
jgi:imidazolonepropionase-like amidohydrolase